MTSRPKRLPQRVEAKHAGKLGAEKLTPEEQRRRFIEAAREAGVSEDEAEFDRALGALLKTPNSGGME